jgi:hypothetical protein
VVISVFNKFSLSFLFCTYFLDNPTVIDLSKKPFLKRKLKLKTLKSSFHPRTSKIRDYIVLSLTPKRPRKPKQLFAFLGKLL